MTAKRLKLLIDAFFELPQGMISWNAYQKRRNDIARKAFAAMSESQTSEVAQWGKELARLYGVGKK